jgi:DNA-binding LytR/AlgR family response regulator
LSRALVVDDEALVRGELVFVLGRIADDFLVDEAADAASALAKLHAERYDVVFLDIALPGMNGLELVTVLNQMSHRPHVVFVSAYDQHALRAFELAATDYVVKPFSEERIAMTMTRVRNVALPSRTTRRAPSSGRIPLEAGDRRLLVKVADVRCVHANGHVVWARTNDGELRFRGSLAECAALLEPLGFLRVHRSYLVNPAHVIEIEPFFGGTYVLRLDDRARSEAPVSRGFMPAVRRAFGL